MSSQLDLDQGGTARAWVNTFLGPSVGWVRTPAGNVLAIIAGGTYTLDLSTTVVTVNTTGSVGIILPSATNPTIPAGAVPGQFVNAPIVIVDVGGHAQAHPISIQPTGVDTIMGLSIIQITVNYGGFTLAPNSVAHTWNSISP